MQNKRLVIAATAALCLLVGGGCESSPKRAGAKAPHTSTDRAATPPDRRQSSQSNLAGDSWPVANQPLAYVSGQPVTAAMVYPRLVEHAGGQVLSEVMLDMLLGQRLSQAGLVVSPDLLDQERQHLLAELSADPDEAARLLGRLRESRGITTAGFGRTLRRNASLRLLVKDQVQVTPLTIQQAYDMTYGEKYEARIITTDTLGQLQRVVAQIKAGTSFIDAAMGSSTDISRSQGGLLPPLSASDATYPAALRDALVKLEPGQVSQPVALQRGYAIVKLERKISASEVKFDDVKDELARQATRQAQQDQMRLLARSLLEQADVVVLDPALKESWEYQKNRLGQ